MDQDIGIRRSLDSAIRGGGCSRIRELASSGFGGLKELLNICSTCDRGPYCFGCVQAGVHPCVNVQQHLDKVKEQMTQTFGHNVSTARLWNGNAMLTLCSTCNCFRAQKHKREARALQI